MLDELLLTFLSENKLFEGMSRDALLSLAKNMTLVNLCSGQYLMHAGDPGDTMYLLYQGRLRVYNGKNKTHAVAEIGVGSVVGELALLTGLCRVADVRAVRDSTLIQIDQATYQMWVLLHPDSAIKMISDSVKRLLPPEVGKTAHALTTLALIPGEQGMPMLDIARKLSRAMSSYKRCLVLSDEDPHVRQAIERGEQVPLEYLNTCEAAYDLLLYVANETADAWSKQCARQADKILIFISDTHSAQTPIIQHLPTDSMLLAETFLTILHEPQLHLPVGTEKLLEAIPADRVLHIQNDEDYLRLGRFFSGHAISLVLSGGGLRGAAHFGLYFALQDAGIPIDLVGGSSFGGLAAAAIGMRLPRAQANEMSNWVDKTLPDLMDYTIPVTSLLRGENLYELLTSVFTKDMRLEDLWIPTFCTAANMTDAELSVLTRGLVWESIRTSISLPGIFPPVVRDGKVYVDGATFNNLPIDVMRERNNGGKVIASSVGTELTHERYFATSSSVSGFDVVMDRFRKEPHQHLPSLIEVLLNAEFMGAQKHMNQIKHLSDFYFDLNVSEFALLDLMHWNAIIDKGYERARRLIKDLGLTKESLGIRS